MADGGQAIDQAQVTELVARWLATALGTGQAWYADLQAAGSLPADDELSQADRVTIARRGRVIEKAAHSVGGSSRVRRKLEWPRDTRTFAVIRHRSDHDALAALSFAKLDGPLEAMLLLYATGDVPRYWPIVKRFGLAVKNIRFAEQALTDAMQRILCGRAVMSQDARAKSLGVRASTYRNITGSCERMLRTWLGKASLRWLKAVSSAVTKCD